MYRLYGEGHGWRFIYYDFCGAGITQHKTLYAQAVGTAIFRPVQRAIEASGLPTHSAAIAELMNTVFEPNRILKILGDGRICFPKLGSVLYSIQFDSPYFDYVDPKNYSSVGVQ